MTATGPGAMGRLRSHGCRATLHCGAALYFETVSLAPDPAEVVPCLRHGYCTVRSVELLAGSQRSRPRQQRAPRRSPAELVAHLGTAEAFTLAELRRARFSLRMITEAARDRLLRIEEDAETVIIRPLLPRVAEQRGQAPR
jgi:hypothetical protein